MRIAGQEMNKPMVKYPNPMKQNKLSLFAVVALGGLLACGAVARADDTTPAKPTPPPPGRGQRMQQMVEKLGLTDDQKPKVEATMKDQREKMTALRDDTSLSADDRKAKVKEIMEATDAKMKTILTADQYAKWEQIRKDMRQRMQNGGGPGANAPKKPDASN